MTEELYRTKPTSQTPPTLLQRCDLPPSEPLPLVPTLLQRSSAVLTQPPVSCVLPNGKLSWLSGLDPRVRFLKFTVKNRLASFPHLSAQSALIILGLMGCFWRLTTPVSAGIRSDLLDQH